MPTVTQARDVLLGVLYGDCLGATWEFHHGPIVGGRLRVCMSTFGHRAGVGTDDTETTIAVAQGLIDAAATYTHPSVTVADRLVEWLDTNPKDVGWTTREALDRYRRNGGDIHSGLTGRRTVANGSLMRSSPFALIGGDAGVAFAVSSSGTTHAHPDVLASVRSYVTMLRALLDGQQVVAADHFIGEPADEPENIHCAGVGYGPYAHDLAVWAATGADDFASGVDRIIRLGGDTDTNGAICGAVLAARFGFPPELTADLDDGRVAQMGELAEGLVASTLPRTRHDQH